MQWAHLASTLVRPSKNKACQLSSVQLRRSVRASKVEVASQCYVPVCVLQCLLLGRLRCEVAARLQQRGRL